MPASCQAVSPGWGARGRDMEGKRAIIADERRKFQHLGAWGQRGAFESRAVPL